MSRSSLTKDMPIVSNDAVYDPKVERVPMECFTEEAEKIYQKQWSKSFEDIRKDGGFDAVSAVLAIFAGHEGIMINEKISFQQAHELLVRTLPPRVPPPAPFAHVRLPYPSCGNLHIDEGEWATKPHHTHACQHCGNVWRPAIINTCGVQFLPGYKNEN